MRGYNANKNNKTKSIEDKSDYRRMRLYIPRCISPEIAEQFRQRVKKELHELAESITTNRSKP